MKNSINAIIFDMGGVLVLTCDPKPREELAKHLGVPLNELNNAVFNSESMLRSEMGEISKKEHWKIILRKFGREDMNVEEIDEIFWSGDCLDQDLMDYIKSLRRKYRIGFLSNAFESAREAVEEQFHFLHNFDLSIFSYEVRLRKPDVRIYHLMCEGLHTSPEQAVFIDDLLPNVEGARQAGLYGIHYQGLGELKKELSTLCNSG